MTFLFEKESIRLVATTNCEDVLRALSLLVRGQTDGNIEGSDGYWKYHFTICFESYEYNIFSAAIELTVMFIMLIE